MSAELHARSLRTLDLFVSTLAAPARPPPAAPFIVTVPKIMAPARSRPSRRPAARSSGA
jgi:hypothetical protein